MNHYLDILNKIASTGRNIKLVVASKNQPLSKILEVYKSGCRDFGENRIQEVLKKIHDGPPDINWHFIGTLQKNKVHQAIGKFALIHSVDSFELAKKISEANQTTPILLQVNTSGESSKHGLSIEAWRPHLEALFSLPHLQIQGLMTMAPHTDDKTLIRQTFRSLRRFGEELHLPHLSMGMSHDYEIALEEGATILRIGSAIFT